MSTPTLRLQSASAALSYQKTWFADLRDEVAHGQPFALVNADAPQEMFRTMGIPYVVNQWWASIISAKQRSADYLPLLRGRGYPDDSEQYSALPLAAAMDPDPKDAPWGGLPTPTFVMSENTGDALHKVFDVWHDELGTIYFPLESAAEETVPVNWWDLMPDRWEQAIGSHRLDLMVAELSGVARQLETTTGRPFRESTLRQVMTLSNEQAEWNRRTRDLLARTRPCPVPINDVIPSVMIPQWHRGTEWARDAARHLYEEVSSLVESGHAVCPDEQVRLMWIGRGLWFDMGMYRRFEQSHGAVFVWSMYLALAADAYARYGDDPLRALAARFCAFRDQMYTPPWSTEWYVNQARHHQIDGVVHLISDDSRGSWFTTHALESAGIPVYELHADNADARGHDATAIATDIQTWLSGPVTAARAGAGERSGGRAATPHGREGQSQRSGSPKKTAINQ